MDFNQSHHDGRYVKELLDVIGGAFNKADVEMMVKIHFNERLDLLVNEDQDLTRIIFELFKYFEKRGGEEALVAAVAMERPNEPAVQKFLSHYARDLLDETAATNVIKVFRGSLKGVAGVPRQQNNAAPSFTRKAFLTACVILASALVGTYFFFTLRVPAQPTVSVQDVIGKPLPTARTALTDAGLLIELLPQQSFVPGNVDRPFIVQSTIPRAGTRLHRNDKVAIGVMRTATLVADQPFTFDACSLTMTAHWLGAGIILRTAASSQLARLDTGGTARLPFGKSRRPVALTAQPNGKAIVLVSDGSDKDPLPSAVFRFNADGSPDIAFGPHPYPASASALPENAIGTALTLQPDGGILIAASTVSPAGLSYVQRLLPDGSIDAQYREGGAMPLNWLHDGLRDPVRLRAIATRVDGSAVIVGETLRNDKSSRAIVFRLRSNGMPDPDFNANGFYVHDIPSLQSSATDVSVAPDGNVYVAGLCWSGIEERRAFVLRLGEKGFPDTNFAEMGMVKALYEAVGTPRMTMLADRRQSVLCYAKKDESNWKGKGLLGSNVEISTTTYKALIVLYHMDSGEYLANRELDVYTVLESPSPVIAVNPGEHTIIAAASQPPDSPNGLRTLLARLHSPGGKQNELEFDPSFSETPYKGHVPVHFDGEIGTISSLGVLGDGRILALGLLSDGGPGTVFLSRFNSDGTPDCTFGHTSAFDALASNAPVSTTAEPLKLDYPPLGCCFYGEDGQGHRVVLRVDKIEGERRLHISYVVW
jgi:uncharacterized delta-60 repeat protein